MGTIQQTRQRNGSQAVRILPGVKSQKAGFDDGLTPQQRYNASHKELKRIKAKAYRKTRRYFNTFLKWKYKISYTRYLELFKQQNGKCAICGKPSSRRLFVDHDRNTGKVRGLLHSECNSSLGVLGDSIEGLERAIDYLKRTS